MRVGDVVSLSEGQKDGPYDGISGLCFNKRLEGGTPVSVEPGSIEVVGIATVFFALKPR